MLLLCCHGCHIIVCSFPRHARMLQPTKVKKTEDGKWKVDIGYIDHHTKDPNNLDARRSVVEAQPQVFGQSSKDEDGKFKVDTSYINHRTGEACE